MRRERGFEVREMTVLTVFALRRLSGFISPPFQAIPVHTQGGSGELSNRKVPILIFSLYTYLLFLSVHFRLHQYVTWKKCTQSCSMLLPTPVEIFRPSSPKEIEFYRLIRFVYSSSYFLFFHLPVTSLIYKGYCWYAAC